MSLYIFDKDGTIKNNTIDPTPSSSELTARKEIRSISSNYVTMERHGNTSGMAVTGYRQKRLSVTNLRDDST